MRYTGCVTIFSEDIMKKILGSYTRVPLVLRILIGLVIGVTLGLFVKDIAFLSILMICLYYTTFLVDFQYKK